MSHDDSNRDLGLGVPSVARRLLPKRARAALANFFASGPLRLGRKLGPILWQLPPSFEFEPKRLEAFLKLLPRSTADAAKLAKRHGFRLTGRSWTRPEVDLPIRHALAVRHASFKTPAFLELLLRHRVALVTADTAGKWPFFEEQTADFAYARLHGDEVLYTSGGRDAFVYFDNDVKVRAPYDAMSLAHLLGLGPKPEAPGRPSGRRRSPEPRPFPRIRSRSARPSPGTRRRTAAPRRYPAPAAPRPKA